MNPKIRAVLGYIFAAVVLYFLGAALAPIVAGLILDTTNNFTNVFLAGAALLLLGALSYAFVLKEPIRSEEHS